MSKKVLVTGGAGYVGSLLTPQLLDAGYEVTVYDVMFFGDWFLPKDNPRLKIISGDIRDTKKLAAALKGQDQVINLACISSFELDEKLSTTVNLDAFEPTVIAAKEAGVRRFIYASSSSVYGVSDSPDVTEDHPLVPLTLYNKYKGMCEPLLLKHTTKGFVGVVFPGLRRSLQIVVDRSGREDRKRDLQLRLPEHEHHGSGAYGEARRR